MLTVNDFTSFENFMSKVDLGLITKLCLEVIFYFVVLFLVKKIIGIFFTKIVAKIKDHEIKRQYATIQYLCISIANVIVFLFFATNILGDLGVDMKPILATAGVFGVAIGFGGKRFVEDIISGLMILLSGQLRAGDYITIDNSTGTVESINLVMIKLRAYNGDVHFVRNGLVEKVINHTRDFSHPIVDVPVAYSTNIPYAIEVLKELGKEIRNNLDFSDYILDEPEIVAIDKFDDSAILLRVRFKTRAMQQWAVQRYFRIMVKEKFDKLNITIPFNQMEVTIKDKA